MYRFDAKALLFYPHMLEQMYRDSGDWPESGVDVTAAERAVYYDTATHIVSADETGRPIMIERPAPSDEVLAAQARDQRDRLLSESDWVVTKSIETGSPVPAAWKAYRQALRDITQQAGFPREIQWPEPLA